jgi:hypothetical protein
VSGAVVMGVIPEMRLNYYLVISFFSASVYAVLINFPTLAVMMHTKPVYYDDLEDEDVVDIDGNHHTEPGKREAFQRLFTRIIQPPLAIFVAILTGYVLYRVKTTQLSLFEIFGVIGGNISIYASCQKYLGQLLLLFLNWRKEKLQRKRKTSLAENEMSSAV